MTETVLKQSDVTQDMANWAKELLHDQINYPLGASTSKSFGTTNITAKVETHPPDFQVDHPHRGITLYSNDSTNIIENKNNETAGSIINDISKSEINSDKPTTQDNQSYINLLSQNLPVVGVLYNGDISQAAQNLEQKIGSVLNKSINGVIFNQETKQFLTTPDDIESALNMLQKYKPTTTASLTRGQRKKYFNYFL